jgi:antitoxin ParD1/3/4
MNVSLTPELDKWINEKIESGLYNSSSEVIREGLRVLIRQEDQRNAMLKESRTELLVGMKQLDSQKSKVFNKDLLKNIKSNARKNMSV